MAAVGTTLEIFQVRWHASASKIRPEKVRAKSLVEPLQTLSVKDLAHCVYRAPVVSAVSLELKVDRHLLGVLLGESRRKTLHAPSPDSSASAAPPPLWGQVAASSIG